MAGRLAILQKSIETKLNLVRVLTNRPKKLSIYYSKVDYLYCKILVCCPSLHVGVLNFGTLEKYKLKTYDDAMLHSFQSSERFYVVHFEQ